MQIKRLRVCFFLIFLAGMLELQCHVISSAYTQILVTASKNTFKLLLQRSMGLDYYPAEHLNKFERVVNMRPDGNAEIHELFGRYYLFRSQSNIGLESDKEDTISSYRNAINTMPAKAEWWARLAYIKALSNEFDDEFYLSYQQAFHYGSHEYFINHILMEIGLAYWYSMSVDSRLIFKRIVIQTYLSQPYAVLVSAREYGQLRMICIWVRGEGESQKMCEKELSR